MSQFFPKPYERFRGNIKGKLDLSNYVPKTDLKGATGANTSNLASKSKLAKLKPKIDKMDIDKLKPVSVDLSKLSDILNNELVRKTVYDKLVAKVNSNLLKINNINTSEFL